MLKIHKRNVKKKKKKNGENLLVEKFSNGLNGPLYTYIYKDQGMK